MTCHNSIQSPPDPEQLSEHIIYSQSCQIRLPLRISLGICIDARRSDLKLRISHTR